MAIIAPDRRSLEIILQTFYINWLIVFIIVNTKIKDTTTTNYVEGAAYNFKATRSNTRQLEKNVQHYISI